MDSALQCSTTWCTPLYNAQYIALHLKKHSQLSDKLFLVLHALCITFWRVLSSATELSCRSWAPVGASIIHTSLWPSTDNTFQHSDPTWTNLPIYQTVLKLHPPNMIQAILHNQVEHYEALRNHSWRNILSGDSIRQLNVMYHFMRCHFLLRRWDISWLLLIFVGTNALLPQSHQRQGFVTLK